MRLVRQQRTEGEGRTVSGLPYATAPSKPVLMLLAWLVVLVSASLRFTMDTASVGRIDSRVIVGASALFAGGLMAAVYWPKGRPSPGRMRLHPIAVGGIALASAVLQAGIPMLVFANRSSDAPPGAVVAFWSTVFFGGTLVVAGAVGSRGRLLRMASALLLMTAGAGVLANWERPSSFSLFVRYTTPQFVMLGGMLASVVLLLLLTMTVERYGWSATALPISGGAALGGVLLLALARESLASLGSPIVMLAAGASAVLYLLILSLGSGRGALVSGTAIAAVPAAITLLTALESAVGMLGPRPLLLGPIVASCAVGASAIVLILREPVATAPIASRRIVMGITLTGLAASMVGMIMPVLGVAVKGGLSDGTAFATTFSMAGYETVAGWLAFSVALLGVTALMSRVDRRSILYVLAAGVTSFAAWTVLRPMPLHTWVSWIPPEVQQDYGTEFASIVFSPLMAGWQLVGMVVTLIAMSSALYLNRQSAGASENEAPSLVEEHS